MYEAFYGLNGKPFNLTPDPRFLYLSQKHKEAFAHLVYGIKNRSGFVMVSGEIGTGKTTICRSLLNQLDEDTELAFIFNPYLSQEELLRKINEEFGIDSHSRSVKGLIDELNAYLLQKAAEGKNCVMVIDEAQNLEVRLLEQIRLLSNLETETQKLLQIILIGQPELVDKLNLPELRQLNQRITARYHLKGLDFEETMQYIAFRLRVAGGRRKVKFSRAAVRAVYVLSKGTPRVINALCDRALLIGYTKESHTITAGIVRQAAREVQGERPSGSKSRTLRWYLPRLAAAAVVVLAIAGVAVIPGESKLFRGAAESARSAWISVFPNANGAGKNLAVATVKPPVDVPDVVVPEEAVSETDAVASQVMAAELPPLEAPPVPLVEPVDNSPEVEDAAWLDRLNPAVSRANALTALLQRWNMAVLSELPSGDGDDQISEFARQNGFAIEWLNATVEQLIVINLPALIRVRTPNGPLWSALLGVNETGVRLSGENGSNKEIALALFEERYASAAAVFWHDPTPEAQPLMPWTRGERVKAFQEILLALGLLEGGADGNYDRRTIDTVRRIQQTAGLRVDGIAGQQTRMVLTSWLGAGSEPKLASESFPNAIRERIMTSDVAGGWMAPRQEHARVPAAGSAFGELGPVDGAVLPDWAALAAVRQTAAGIDAVALGPGVSGGDVREESEPKGNGVAARERPVTAPSPAAFVLVPSSGENSAGEDAAR